MTSKETRKPKTWEEAKSQAATPLQKDISYIADRILGGIGDVAYKGATMANMAGANVLDYATGSKVFSGAGAEMEKAGWGNIVDPAVSKPAGIGATKKPITTQAPQPVQQENKPENKIDATKFKDIYEAMENMSDEGFKRFLKNHGDKLPGSGFAIKKDASGKEVLHRTIQRPEQQEEQPQFQGGISRRDAAIAERILSARDQRDYQDRMLALAENKQKNELDMTNPVNQIKLARELGKKTKTMNRDPLTMEIIDTTEEQDVASGLGIMKKMGLPVDENIMKNFSQGNERANAGSSAPKVGEIVKGYRFKGGEPSDKNSWEKK